MTYYRAKRDAFDYFNQFGVVKDELLTAKERHTKCRYLMDSIFEIVEIPRTRTFINFGVRFEKK